MGVRMKYVSSPYLRAAQATGRIVAQATPYAVKAFQGVRALQKARQEYKQSKVSSSGPITTQYDQSTRYRRKRMPARKRRQWKRFTKKVRHVMLQMNSLTSFTNDNYRTINSWVANAQASFGVYLGGTGVSSNDEILAMFKSAYSAALTNTTVDDYKLFIKSLCLDVQLTNTGSFGAIIDVYELIARASDNNSAETIGSMFARLYLEQNPSALGSPDPSSPAVTAFQNGMFLTKWKVLRKKEILLGVGQVTTMQMRNPYNRIMQGKTVESNNSYIPGFTRAYLFQARGVPRNNAGTAELPSGEITMCCQITGTYGIPPGSSRATASDN